MRPPTSSDPSSFSSRFLGQILQLSFVQYPLKLLQKASIWVGLVFPVGTSSKLCPSQSSPRPGFLARKHRGRLVHLLLSVIPTRIQSFLGHLPADQGQSNMSKEIREAPINPSKASKRKRDDVALEEQESWAVFLERDLPEDDSEDPTYEPSEVGSDSEEYLSHNDTDLELQELGGITVLQEPSDLQGSVLPPEPGPEDPAVFSSGEGAPAVASGDVQTPQSTGSSGDGREQEAGTACDSSTLSQDGENQEA